MNWMKRTLSAGLAVVMACSMVACSSSPEDKWAAELEGEKIPTGVYIYNVMTAYSEAAQKVADQSKAVLKQEIDGKNASDWITERAMANFKQMLYVEKQFKDLGLSLSEDDIKTLESYTTQMWNYYGENYEELGIAQSSFNFANENTMKSSRIFQTIYGDNGEKAISEEELRKVYDEKYSKITYLMMQKPTSSEGSYASSSAVEEAASSLADNGSSSAEGQEDVAADTARMKQKIQGYVDRINAGEDIYAIISEYEKENLAEGEKTHCETAGEKAHDLLNNKDSSQLPAAFFEELAKYEIGQAFLYEADSYFMLVKKLDPSADPEDFDSAKESIRMDLKWEEFEEALKQESANFDGFTLNQKVIDRYTPKKLNLE